MNNKGVAHYTRCLKKHLGILPDITGVHIILYGSTVFGHSTNGDIDICVVLDKDGTDIVDIRALLNKCFPYADVRFYYAHELNNPLFFRDINSGTFAVEYLAYGVAVVGENPFVALAKRISRPAYRQSLKHKTFDYVLRIRRVYLNKKRGKAELAFLKKYIRRIAIDLLLFKELESFSVLNAADLPEVLMLLHKHQILNDSSLTELPKDTQPLFEKLFLLNDAFGDIVFQLPDELFDSIVR